MNAVTLILLAAGVLAIVPAPYWLPATVVRLRIRIFALVNGDEGVPVPGPTVGVNDFARLYADRAANGRSRGAALSDLFWYWLAPGPHVHQEHLEPGPRYDQAAAATRQILARLRKDEWSALAARCAAHVLDGQRPGRARLRDLMMPIWAEVYYELVFAEPCPAPVRDLIVAHADDVVSALKCTRLRHMRRRERLTRYLRGRIDAGTVPAPLPDLFTPQEQAWYLQGTFFNTAVVQMSEACAHVLMALAEHPDVQERMRSAPDGDPYVARVLDESLRLYPLFGIAHRITSADIVLDPDRVIPSGSVLLFNYEAYQHAGVADPHRFDPQRWTSLERGSAHFIPFGVSANRPCPARGVAPPSTGAVVNAVLARFTLATSAGHTRSLPNRGPVLLRTVGAADRPVRGRLALQRIVDRYEDVTRSLTQLLLGTYMVLDARRLGLCRRHFADQPAAAPTPNR